MKRKTAKKKSVIKKLLPVLVKPGPTDLSQGSATGSPMVLDLVSDTEPHFGLNGNLFVDQSASEGDPTEESEPELDFGQESAPGNLPVLDPVSEPELQLGEESATDNPSVQDPASGNLTQKEDFPFWSESEDEAVQVPATSNPIGGSSSEADTVAVGKKTAGTSRIIESDDEEEGYLMKIKCQANKIKAQNKLILTIKGKLNKTQGALENAQKDLRKAEDELKKAKKALRALV